MSKLTVKKAAIMTRSGEVVPAKNAHQAHADIQRDGKKVHGQHGFILSDGSFASRKEAATVGESAGEIPKSAGKKLHSHELRQALGIKRDKAK